MSKISELSDGGSLLATDDLIVVRSGGNVRARLSGVTDLSVSTKVSVTGTSSSLNLMESDTTDTNHRIRQSGGDLVIQKVSDDLSTVNNRLLVSGSTGDISFYNTTGQAKLTWDASAESLGIGTSSPSAPLDIVSSATGGTTLELDNTSTGGRNYTLYSSGSGNSFGAGNFALYDADAAAVRLLVDSSGNVGIGTSSVNRALEIAGNNNGGAKANYIRITDTDTSATANNQQGGIEFFTNDPTAGICASIEVLYAGSGGGGEITFNTNSNSGGTLTEAMRIDESGNVGIGATSPSNNLHIASAAAAIRLEDTDNNSYGQIVYNTASGGLLIRSDEGNGVGSSQSNIILETDGIEAARIDSSGNLLVGTTNTDPAGTSNNVVGTAIGSSGYLSMTRDGNTVAFFNRKSDDGTVVQFRKDGSVVGSIGANGGLPYFAGASIGLKISGTQIRPCNSTGQNNDNAVDLGKSDTRFKDLYLSGGAFLGGTGAANKLDDYEEGTWTPNIQRFDGTVPATFSVQPNGSRYTKIGNVVHLITYLSSISAGSSNGSSYWVIYGIPFASQVIDYSAAALAYNSTAADSVYLGDAGGNALLVQNNQPFAGTLAGDFMLNVTYKVT